MRDPMVWKSQDSEMYFYANPTDFKMFGAANFFKKKNLKFLIVLIQQTGETGARQIVNYRY